MVGTYNTSDDYLIALKLQEDEFGVRSKANINHGQAKQIAKKTVVDRPLSIVDETWELIDPLPDIRQLFLQFNDAYFDGLLAGVEVKWSPRMTLCAGLCSYEGRGGLCSVRLSQPLLKLRPRRDLVQTLLHEMIHAVLFVTHNNKDHDAHGDEFHKHMHRINNLTGTKITVYHSFHDEVNQYKTHWWRCEGSCRTRHPFFGYVKRAMNRAPSRNDTWWNEHQRTCGGTFVKVKEPEDYGKKKKRNGKENKDDGESLPKKAAFPGKGKQLDKNSNTKLDKWFMKTSSTSSTTASLPRQNNPSSNSQGSTKINSTSTSTSTSLPRQNNPNSNSQGSTKINFTATSTSLPRLNNPNSSSQGSTKINFTSTSTSTSLPHQINPQSNGQGSIKTVSSSTSSTTKTFVPHGSASSFNDKEKSNYSSTSRAFIPIKNDPNSGIGRDAESVLRTPFKGLPSNSFSDSIRTPFSGQGQVLGYGDKKTNKITIIDDNNSDDDIEFKVFAIPNKKKKQIATPSIKPQNNIIDLPDNDVVIVTDSPISKTIENHVTCPVCCQNVKQNEINRHLDNCLG